MINLRHTFLALAFRLDLVEDMSHQSHNETVHDEGARGEHENQDVVVGGDELMARGIPVAPAWGDYQATQFWFERVNED